MSSKFHKILETVSIKHSMAYLKIKVFLFPNSIIFV